MKKLVILFTFILIISFVSAISVDYKIIGNKVLVEADFGNVNNFKLRIPYDISIFELDSEYDIVNMKDYKILKVNSSSDLRFSYVTETMIDISKTKNFFIINNYFPESVDIRLFLPENGVLMKDYSLIFPDADEITTDGRRVILEWKNFDKEEIVVAYEKVQEEIILNINLL